LGRIFKWLKPNDEKGYIQARHLTGIYFAETPERSCEDIEKRAG